MNGIIWIKWTYSTYWGKGLGVEDERGGPGSQMWARETDWQEMLGMKLRRDPLSLLVWKRECRLLPGFATLIAAPQAPENAHGMGARGGRDRE